MQVTNKQYKNVIKVVLFLITFTGNGALTLMSQPVFKASINDIDPPTLKLHPPRHSFDVELTMDSTQARCMLHIENPTGKKLLVRIYSNFYGELFRCETQDIIFRNNLNLEGVEDGSYVIEVAAGKEKVKKRLSLTTVMEVSRKMVINK